MLHTMCGCTTIRAMEHTEWMHRITAGDSLREVARRAGLNNRTLTTQVNAGKLKADLIIKIAEAYDESPVIALVDLGFMSARWITEPGVVTALSRATDEQLTDELLRRLRLIDDVSVDDLAARHLHAVADSSPEEGEGYPDDYEP